MSEKNTPNEETALDQNMKTNPAKETARTTSDTSNAARPDASPKKAADPTEKDAAEAVRRVAKQTGLDLSNISEDSEEEKHGAKVRRRNMYISIICGVIFFALLYWLLKSGKLSDTKHIQEIIQKAGPFGPILFILFSVFTSYIPIIPMGSMGSIGIVVFGALPAFFYNTLTSYINCFLAYWLAKRFGIKMILQIATPKAVARYESWLKNSKHYELFFALFMMMPVSPDLILCMIAGLLNMKFSHYFWIIIISRPFSSWCYSMGLLKVFEWLRKAVHL